MEKASKHDNYHYNKKLNSLAKANRKNMTKSAVYMWKYVLSGKKMMKYQFRRERPILDYIVDFVCLELLLIIEVDGITHDSYISKKLDRVRDRKLKKIGFEVLRFSSWEVLNRINDTFNIIAEWIERNKMLEPQGKRNQRKVNSTPLPPQGGFKQKIAKYRIDFNNENT